MSRKSTKGATVSRIFLKLNIAISISLLIFGSYSVLAESISGQVKAQGLRSAKNVVVYLSKAPQKTTTMPSTGYVMDQHNLSFSPHILPIPVGATVEFPNNDKVEHNVFSASRARKFNLGTFGQGKTKRVTFEKAGIIELRCDMHAEMSAYILVMKNPYFAITDAKGKFSISKPLPPGNYTIRTWHEKLKSHKQKVQIPESGKVFLKLKLKRGTPGVLYKR